MRTRNPWNMVPAKGPRDKYGPGRRRLMAEAAWINASSDDVTRKRRELAADLTAPLDKQLRDPYAQRWESIERALIDAYEAGMTANTSSAIEQRDALRVKLAESIEERLAALRVERELRAEIVATRDAMKELIRESHALKARCDELSRQCDSFSEGEDD